MVGGNIKDFSEAVSQHPLLVSKGIQVEIRTHAIKIEQQEKLKQEDMVKALHVYGDYNKMATIREDIQQIYREGVKKMMFVPNIADPRYPVTAGTKSYIKIL
jgi:predicted ribonuclease YlaK